MKYLKSSMIFGKQGMYMVMLHFGQKIHSFHVQFSSWQYFCFLNFKTEPYEIIKYTVNINNQREWCSHQATSRWTVHYSFFPVCYCYFSVEIFYQYIIIFHILMNRFIQYIGIYNQCITSMINHDDKKILHVVLDFE